ncbi:KRAB-A domain-containing protein 2 [Plakobranchus ocellatus]|uniref:KRAB-A domain-containing protein 2 n=1 Tax=Plakobranchus ocellatus TaxID=259542 RepID=A0AAV3Z0S0_9GAST|nr:KRAB-A domain-containing protein 2 [Plakobranchus ocellatus]
MAAPFPISDRAIDVRLGCKTQRIAPTLRQVADLMCARIKEREYFKTCIVGHVNCCLQCAPTLKAAADNPHGGKGRMLKELKKKYVNISTKAVELFRSLCQECQKKRKGR